ncbi:unnamed protein product [Caenorhabditis nigoni]
MSGGQKQRIARAHVRDPQQALSRCAQDMTVLVIAHRLSIVRNSNNIAVIEHGGVKKERLDIVNWVLPKKRARQSVRLSKPKQRTTKFTKFRTISTETDNVN